MEAAEESRVFLDGKSQMIEMLRAMPPADRMRVLRSLRPRSPRLARELEDGSIPFEDLAGVPPARLRAFLRRVSPVLLGMALKGMGEGFQRSVLAALDREDAVAAYASMTRPVSGEETCALRARARVLEDLEPGGPDRPSPAGGP